MLRLTVVLGLPFFGACLCIETVGGRIQQRARKRFVSCSIGGWTVAEWLDPSIRSPARHVGATVSLARIEGKMGERGEGACRGFEPHTPSPKTTTHPSTTPPPSQRLPTLPQRLTTQAVECLEFLSGRLAQVSLRNSTTQEFFHITVHTRKDTETK
jgi:hypothetical protein